MKNKKEKLNTLLTKYPEVFVTAEDKWGGTFEGFGCNDGWFSIVHDFCQHLKSHNETMELYALQEWRKDNKALLEDIDKNGQLMSVPPNGGSVSIPITKDNIEQCLLFTPTVKIKISCVKEKFGTLRIYCDGNDNTDEFTWGMIVMAQGMSHYFCEDCGTTHGVGKTHGVESVGWIRNICKPCYDEWVKSGYGGGSEPRKEAWEEKENPGDSPMILVDTFENLRKQKT